MTDTPNLGLPLIAAAQAQKHVTHNEALAVIDVLLQCAVLDKDLATPPAAPAEGVRYIVGPSPVAGWAGQERCIAAWQHGAWRFYAPQPGFVVFVADEGLLYFHAAAEWLPLSAAAGALQNLALLGLGTTADAANPFSAKLNKALWTAKSAAEGGTGDLRYTLNKDAVANVLSLLFQTGFAARAELGLIGGDDLVLRLSPDGTSFFAGLRANKDLHGRLSVKEAMRKTWAAWTPQPGTAGVNALGLGTVQAGTLTAVAPSANVSFYAQTPRIKLVSAAVAGASASLSGAGLGWWRGNAPDQGGVYLMLRAGFEVFQPGARLFMGLHGAAVSIGNVNPSTLLNLIGIGADSGETTLRLLSNDASGTATRVDLGAGFAVGAHELYELILSAEPNASTVQYRVERLNGGNVAIGTFGADLPVNTAFLTPHIWANTGAGTAAVELGLVGMYVENAALNGSRGKIA